MMKKIVQFSVMGAVVLGLVVGPAGAIEYNLTASGPGQVEINGAWFYDSSTGSTGTGTIDPFLRIQKNGVEQGYNTDYRPAEYPEMTDPWTKSLLLSAVPAVQLDGVWYREFLLDIHQAESQAGRMLSLDKLEIYLADVPNLTGHGSGGWGDPLYELGEDNWIKLDGSLNSGSGSGDMFAYIPNSLFVGGDYVYLYSMFGVTYPANATFEEWAVRIGGDTPPPPPPPPPVPVPGTMLLGVLGLGAAGLKLRRWA